MKDILYDIFIKGVIPLGIVALLGYFSKRIITHQKERIWYHLSTLVIIIAAVILSNRIYIFTVNPYVTHCVPENCILIGANTHSDLNKSYWLVKPGEIVSLPIPVKLNRIVSLNITFDGYPFEIEYKTDKGFIKEKINIPKATILDAISVDKLIKGGVTLSEHFGKFQEQILPFKFSTNKEIKIYSFEISRNFSTLRNNITAIIFILMIAFWSIGVILWIYRIKIKPNKALQ